MVSSVDVPQVAVLVFVGPVTGVEPAARRLLLAGVLVLVIRALSRPGRRPADQLADLVGPALVAVLVDDLDLVAEHRLADRADRRVGAGHRQATFDGAVELDDRHTEAFFEAAPYL